MDREVAIQVASLRFFSRSPLVVLTFFFSLFSPERRFARDKEHGAFRRILREDRPFLLGRRSISRKYGQLSRPVLPSVRNPLSCVGRLDISREACRIVSRDKMSDLSLRKRKRERRIKGQVGRWRGR